MGRFNFDYSAFWTQFGTLVNREPPAEVLSHDIVSKYVYLHWASQFFELPILREEYFWRSDSERMDALKEVREEHSEKIESWIWTEQCVPVASFEETLMVACIHPPNVRPPRVQFLLTTFENLKNCWNLWQKFSFNKDPVLQALASLSPHYRASCFGTVDIKSLEFRPTIWHRLKPVEDTRPVLSLQESSPFRVALTTRKPYHGYCVPNAVLESFCNLYNEGVSLQSLTVLPIVNRSTLTVRGLLVALPGAEYSESESLKSAQAIADQLERFLDQNIQAA